MRHPNPLIAAFVDAKDREYLVESGQVPATREELLRMAGESDMPTFVRKILHTEDGMREETDEEFRERIKATIACPQS